MADTDDPGGGDERPSGEIPFNPDEMRKPPPWAVLDAKKEQKQWPDLDEIKQANDKRWLIVYGWVLVALTIVFAVVFLGAFVVWAWHYLTCWTWLEEHQLGKIQSILFSGGMGAVVTSIVRTQMGKA